MYCEYADGTTFDVLPGPCPVDYQGFALVASVPPGETYTLPVEVFEHTTSGPRGPVGPAGALPWFAIATLGVLMFALLGGRRYV